MPQQLRAELARGQPFRGNSSAEIVLRAYERWGLADTLTRLRGSFALAIYDRSRAQLTLARDALGTRPLYYLQEAPAGGDAGSLMFASELKALQELADAELLNIDYTSVYDYLTYRYIPAPKTLYRQVRKLPAGHYVSFNLVNGRATSSPYWTLPEPDGAADGSEDAFVASVARSCSAMRSMDASRGCLRSPECACAIQGLPTGLHKTIQTFDPLRWLLRKRQRQRRPPQRRCAAGSMSRLLTPVLQCGKLCWRNWRVTQTAHSQISVPR